MARHQKSENSHRVHKVGPTDNNVSLALQTYYSLVTYTAKILIPFTTKLKTYEMTHQSWSNMVPMCGSQTMTLVSYDAVASRAPSGEKSQPHTSWRCPWRYRTALYLTMSHSITWVTHTAADSLLSIALQLQYVKQECEAQLAWKYLFTPTFFSLRFRP